MLEPYKSSKNRFKCPSCGKPNQFTRYINTEVSEYVDVNVGKCNRIEKCGYHLTPKTFVANSIGSNRYESHRFDRPEPIAPPVNRYNRPEPITFLDREILIDSYNREGENHFMKYLESLFGTEIAGRLKKEYLIGTHSKNTDRVDFFQVDGNGKVRQAKNMGYDPVTGKKVNVFFSFPKNKHPEYNLVQCFFGEHLLKRYPNKKVGIVESEKTAIIASVYVEELVWLAAGNANGLNLDKTKVLDGRDVILYPDLGQYDNWKKKVHTLHPNSSYSVSKVLENRATESARSEGFDIADYLVRTEVEKFRNKSTLPQAATVFKSETFDNQSDKDILAIKYDPTFEPKEFENLNAGHESEKSFSETHKDQIDAMETFFKSIGCEILNAPITIGPGEKITDPSKLIETHLRILRAAKKEKGARPYYDRLNGYKELLSINKNQKL